MFFSYSSIEFKSFTSSIRSTQLVPFCSASLSDSPCSCPALFSLLLQLVLFTTRTLSAVPFEQRRGVAVSTLYSASATPPIPISSLVSLCRPANASILTFLLLVRLKHVALSSLHTSSTTTRITFRALCESRCGAPVSVSSLFTVTLTFPILSLPFRLLSRRPARTLLLGA